jgi:hypothetical protein
MSFWFNFHLVKLVYQISYRYGIRTAHNMKFYYIWLLLSGWYFPGYYSSLQASLDIILHLLQGLQASAVLRILFSNWKLRKSLPLSFWISPGDTDYTCVPMSTPMHIHPCPHVCIHMHIYVHTPIMNNIIPVYTHQHIHLQVCVCVCMCMYIYI